MKTILVNRADWDGPDLPAGWLIANAPRPLGGERTWQAAFRHGVLYAAMPADPGADEWDRKRHAAALRRWESLDGWLVEFTDNGTIREACEEKAREHGYAGLSAAEDDGVHVADIAAMLGLPWHDEEK